jgi:hypothetical protein
VENQVLPLPCVVCCVQLEEAKPRDHSCGVGQRG